MADDETGRAPGRRGVGPAKFSAVILGVALVLFALPYPTADQIRSYQAAKASTATIAIVGPSTITHVSRCDSDQRNVPAMLGDLMGEKVLDLSYGGQSMSDSLNLAALGDKGASVTDVVLPLAFPLSDTWTTPTYRKLIVNKAMTPGFETFKASNLDDLWSGLSEQPNRNETGYTFEGRTWHDYRGIAAREFVRERKAERCPEVAGQAEDPAFVRSYFWWTNVQVERNTALPPLVADLKAELGRHNRRLHVLLMPTNLDYVAKLDPAWRQKMEATQKELVADFAAQGVQVIDASSGYPESEFTGQWCACIHLSESGRLHLSQTIASQVRAGRKAAGAL